MNCSIEHRLEFTPPELGLPEKFAHWRPGQDDAVARILDSTARFVGVGMPTGGGKTLVYVAAARLLGKRTVILTSTKGLQSQLLDDFQSLGMTDIRGRANYRCCIDSLNCEQGAHVRCSVRRSDDCDYYHHYRLAVGAELVVTNYAYWPMIHRYGEGLGKVDMLVCDEAHDAPDAVCSIMTVAISPQDVFRRLRLDWPRDTDSVACWRQWASRCLPVGEEYKEAIAEEVRTTPSPSARLVQEMTHAASLCANLATLAASRGEWVSETSAGGGWRLAPVWPAEYAEDVLFLAIPKVVLVSATLLPKTLEILGIDIAGQAQPGDTEDGGGDGVGKRTYEFFSYPSTFPPRRSPVYHVPTCRVHHNWNSDNQTEWLKKIDSIIEGRLDRRGLIHSVSYDRRDLILSRSRFADYMLSHQPGSEAAMEQVRRHCNTPPPSILLSPAMTTGYDFAGDACEYIIVCKVPFPDTRSRITQARCGRLYPTGSWERERGREYELYSAIQTLVQESGRGMRSDKDQCEVFVVDDHIVWIMRRYLKLVPVWWRRLYVPLRAGSGIPKPPPALVWAAGPR